MKPLTPTLEAAQQRRHRLPYVEAVINDFERGISRIYWERLYTGAEPDNHHGIAFDGAGNMHRIRAEGTTLYRQRIVSPDEFSDYSPWTVVTTDCAGPCAIAAHGEKVYIFYRQNSVNRLRYYRSHDYGASWTDAVLVNYTDVISMAAAWWAGGTGFNVVCFTLRTNEISAVVWNSDTQALVVHRITTFVPPHPITITATAGIGATYSSREARCQIVFAGLQSDTPYNHYNVFRCYLSAMHHFSAMRSFAMVPYDPALPPLTTYEYPDCHFPALPPVGSGFIPDHEPTRITLVEKFDGIAPYERPLTCHMVRDTTWMDTAYTEPRPFVDDDAGYGVRLASDAGHWWLSKPDGVWRAARVPPAPVDITPDIVNFTLRTHAVASAELASGPGTLVIELDNSRGQYSPAQFAIHHSPFTIDRLRRAELELRLGYRTSDPAGPETVPGGTFWIDSWHHSSSINQSLFTIYCLDGWSLANRWTPRHQLRWNHNGTPHNVWEILYVVLARIGIRLRDGAWPRSHAVLNFYPDFTLVPGQRGDTAIRRLLSMVPDVLVFLGQDAFVKNPLPGEATCYEYGPGEHEIARGRYGQAVTASRTRAIGRDALDQPVVADAFDWELQDLFDYLVVTYDPNLDAHAAALARAEAVLRTLALDANPAAITIPTNVGQELLDVVEVTDPRCGFVSERFRVRNIITEYDWHKARYEQTLALGAP